MRILSEREHEGTIGYSDRCCGVCTHFTNAAYGGDGHGNCDIRVHDDYCDMQHIVGMYNVCDEFTDKLADYRNELHNSEKIRHILNA